MKKSEKNLSSKIDSLLNGLVGRLEKLESVAIEQFPDIVKEILAERKVELQNNMIKSGIGTAIVGPIFLFTAHIAIWGSGGLQFGCGLGALITGIASFALGADTLDSYLTTRELKAAPKVYVINRLKRMITR